MRHSKHDIFPSHFSGLTKEESAKLEEDLLKHITQADGFESFEDMEKELLCPNCGGSHIVRRGYRGKAMTTRRYFCRECRKGFQISNGPIIADSRYGPERWKPFVHAVLNGEDLQHCAAAAQIAAPTACNWRQRVWNAARDLSDAESGKRSRAALNAEDEDSDERERCTA